MPKLFVFFILVFFKTLFLQSQSLEEGVQLEGKVLNKVLESPVDATLVLESLPYGADNRIFKSDPSSGEFAFTALANKRYKVKVMAKGYLTTSREIVVQPEMQPLIFKLIPSGSGALLSLNINFSQGKSKILEDSFEELNKLIEMLKEYPSMVIQLEGHTDFRGSESANLRLSERRVQAVKKYLTSENIDSKRIKTKAFGGSLPISKKSSPEARLKNRRVEARILKN